MEKVVSWFRGMTASKPGSKGGLWENIKTIVYAVLIATVIRTFFFEPFSIPSGSMYPTLLVGDYLFISKYSYGYSKHSFPFSPDLFGGRIWEGAPERGDVVVFKLPSDNSTDYIKRVIGLPGDRIQMVKGVLTINGTPVERRQIEDWVERTSTGGVIRATQYLETLPNGKQHRIIETDGDSGSKDNTPVYVVPQGHYFMMGDNRDNSQDSRYLGMVGYVPAENVLGRAEFLFFATDGSSAFWEFWRWPWSIRFSRFFTAVE